MWSRGGCFEESELQPTLLAVDAVEQHAHWLADAEDAAGAPADDGAVRVAEHVTVFVAVVFRAETAERSDRHDAFDEEVGELDEKAVLGAGEDNAGEVLADAVFFLIDILSIHLISFGVVGAAF